MPSRRLSIRTAIGVALVAGIAAPTAIGSWYLVDRQRQVAGDELDRDHRRLTEVVALGMRQPLWTMVPGLGEPLLESAMRDERVVRIAVTAEGRPFLSSERAERRRGEQRVLVEPIAYRGEELGEVLVEIDTGQMEGGLAEQTRGLLLVVAAQIAVSLVVISVLLRSKVLLPIERLLRQSSRLARGELDEPFRWHGDDELGRLGQSFEHSRRSLLTLVEALEEKNRQLERLNEGLETALAARSLFLATMSHELRTPLNSILGFGGLLAERLAEREDERLRRFAEHVLSSGNRLLQLVDDVLDLSQIEAGRATLHLETVDVAAVLYRMCEMVRPEAGENEVSVVTEIAEPAPRLVADPAKVKQIVFNLLSNAVKFSPRGTTVTVRAACAPGGDAAATSQGPARPGARIEVADQGIGIAPADQEVIFEPFRQVEESPGRRFEGSGLGLAIVARMVELHGGSIEVDSTVGEGSTFTVFLPSLEDRRLLASTGSDGPAATDLRSTAR